VIALYPNWQGLCKQAYEIRRYTFENLDRLLAQLSERLKSRGVKVFYAEGAQDACDYVLKVIQNEAPAPVVKSKSMTTEEICLREYLQWHGIEVYETDLGEFIIQLAGEAPSHLTAPAIHKSRDQIGRLFCNSLHVPYTEDPSKLVQIAREFMREKFLSARVGITGANFAVAQSGTLVIVENEANARLSMSLPKVHVAIIGIDKIIPTIQDATLLLRLLIPSATGQKITSYISFVQGPDKDTQPDGPHQMHVVILDGGRRAILKDPKLRQVLYCIRCGGCLNICQIYNIVGGHGYGGIYPGPIGSLFMPLMDETKHRDLPFLSTLCGRCSEICPVGIKLHHLLPILRARLRRRRKVWWHTGILKTWFMIMSSFQLYRMVSALARIFALPVAHRSFHQKWHEL
jgi:L-lactate dehydrogenase complex protein LldF